MLPIKPFGTHFSGKRSVSYYAISASLVKSQVAAPRPISFKLRVLLARSLSPYGASWRRAARSVRSLPEVHRGPPDVFWIHGVLDDRGRKPARSLFSHRLNDTHEHNVVPELGQHPPSPQAGLSHRSSSPQQVRPLALGVGCLGDANDENSRAMFSLPHCVHAARGAASRRSRDSKTLLQL